MADDGGGKFRILVLYDSRKCIPRRVFKEFYFCATHIFLFSRKVEGPWPTRPPSVARALLLEHVSKLIYFLFILKFLKNLLLDYMENDGDDDD